MAYQAFITQHNNKLVLCIVVGKSSLDRILQHDPLIHEGSLIAEHIQRALPEVSEQDTRAFPVRLLDIMLCYEEDEEIVAAKMLELGDGHAVMKWLARGWMNTPDDELPVEWVRTNERA